MKKEIVQRIKSAPQKPGVYIFYSRRRPIYIGKASNLRNRLASYLKLNDYKSKYLSEEATNLKIKILRSEIEALIEESSLIKKYRPKYNVVWRDDKNYFYVGLTKGKFPKIFITHQVNSNNKRYYPGKSFEYIGPFTDGRILKLVLKLLRRSFPYCSCNQEHLRNCLNAQIGLCLGFCCNKNKVSSFQEKVFYTKNIRAIKLFLSGQKNNLIKDSIPTDRRALDRIWQHRDFVSVEIIGAAVERKSQANLLNLDKVKRIEGYDIAHLSGQFAYGAMTVLVKNEFNEFLPDKKEFRLFKIKSANKQNDPAMLAEILSRRFAHSEWLYPQLIIVDGGVGQFSLASRVLDQADLKSKINIISFAKPTKEIHGKKGIVKFLSLSSAERGAIERAIYFTHNFATRAHKRSREKSLF